MLTNSWRYLSKYTVNTSNVCEKNVCDCTGKDNKKKEIGLSYIEGNKKARKNIFC